MKVNSTYSIANIGKIIAGAGSVAKISEIIEMHQPQDVLIISDEGVLKAGLVEGPKAILEERGIAVELIHDIPAEPALAEVERVYQQAQKRRCQLVIGIGGGSVMDVAKMTALLLTNDVDLRALAKGEAVIRHRSALTLMIPTTAGTGSEATPNAIFLMPEDQLKVGIVNERMIADYVILDPIMTAGLPKHITANTGMDALCHAIECYISKKANPFSDVFALEAVRLIGRSILQAYQDGGNLAAREDMLLGATYGGICIASSGTTAVHALSYPLGGKYGIPHGLANSILLPGVMKFNLDACQERFADIARALDLQVAGLTSAEAAGAMIEHLYFLTEAMNIHCNLEQKGITSAVIDELVDAAAKVTRLLDNNPKVVTKSDMKEIYQQLLAGQ